jgi:hypothetical protein
MRYSNKEAPEGAGMISCIPVIPALRRQRWENPEFKVS